MLSAFLLGLFGSVGHCSGMCSGIALLLGRTSGAHGWRVILLHLGRITTYGALGLVAGGFGHALATMGGGQMTDMTHGGVELPGLMLVQGGLALLAAAMAVYMAIAFMGRAPSPELLLGRVTSWWGRTMRRVTVSNHVSNHVPGTGPQGSANRAFSDPSPARLLFTTYTLGLLWGLLPCGLVLMALLLAAVSGSMQQGALTMIVFGVGTWPLVVAITLAPRMQLLQRRAAGWVRPATAAIILLFGLQMALRGLAAWGLVDHAHWGGVVLW